VSRKDYRAELAKVWPALNDMVMLNARLGNRLGELMRRFGDASAELDLVTEERDCALLRIEELEAELGEIEAGHPQ
jgi:hypothetical protein